MPSNNLSNQTISESFQGLLHVSPIDNKTVYRADGSVLSAGIFGQITSSGVNSTNLTVSNNVSLNSSIVKLGSNTVVQGSAFQNQISGSSKSLSGSLASRITTTNSNVTSLSSSLAGRVTIVEDAMIVMNPNPQELYVDFIGGSDVNGDGTVVKPYKSIQYAVGLCTDVSKTYTLLLANAVYTGSATTIPANVNIEGNGAQLQFDVTLGNAGLSGSQVQPYYIGCSFQEFIMNLTVFSIALPTFDTCNVTKLTRTDTLTGARVVRFSDGSCADFSIKGNVAFDNTLFLGTGTVETGGTLFLKNTIIGVPIDVEAAGTIVMISDVFVGPTGILTALATGAILRTDSTSYSGFGGSIVGDFDIYFLDDVESIAYTPSVSNIWNPIPLTAGEAIDSLAQNKLGRIFSQTANGTTVTNTITETDIIGAGQGSLTVPSGSFSVGDSFNAKLCGHISCNSSATIRLRVKSGAVVLSDSGVIALSTATTKHWSLDLGFTIRSIGTAGSAAIATGGVFSYTKDAGTTFEGFNFSTVNNTTFNTAISNTLSVTVEWGAANAANSIYSEICTLYKTY